MNVDSNLDTQQPPARPGLSGRWMVLITLSLFLVVPAVTFLAWQLSQGEPTRLKLDYDQRAQWFMQPVTPRPLTYDMFVASEAKKKYKRTALALDPEVEQSLHRCVLLAKSDDFFESDGARDTLLALAKQPDNGFYPAYLLAEWYRVNNEPAEHDRWVRAAFDRAGGALAQRLVDEDGQPVAGYTLPPVAIGYDRVINGERDATLVLVYPAPTSEANGFVYLPTFRSIYRLTDPDQPIGVDPGKHPIKLTLLPQEPTGPVPNWFAVPDGAVGRFEDAVIKDAP